MNSPKNKRGFTLIELSIVLVIIGLIVGGVLVGRDLIAGAQIRAQIKQIDQFKTAMGTFRLKYGYLPGDIPEPSATSYGFTTRGTGKYQGDGDGVITGGCVLTFRYGCETALFWKDLGQANLIEQNFPLITYNGGSIVVSAATGMGDYLPKAKLGQNYIHAALNMAQSGNAFYMAAITSTSSPAADPIVPAGGISPHQMYSLDTKLDDGLPATGLMRIIIMTGGYSYDTTYSASRCAISATQYNVGSSYADDITLCQMQFMIK